MGKRKIELCGDIDTAVENGQYTVSVGSAKMYNQDKDPKRDREVASGLNKIMYDVFHKEASYYIKLAVEAIHDSKRYQDLIGMPHYKKIIEDVIMDAFLKHTQQ